MPKHLTMWITINCGKFWRRQEYQTTWPASWETYRQVRKQQLELDMEHNHSSLQKNLFIDTSHLTILASTQEHEYICAAHSHPYLSFYSYILTKIFSTSLIQFSLVTQLCFISFVTLCTAASQESPSITNSWGLLKLMSSNFVMPSNHLSLCCPLLLLSSIFPSIRVFPMS